MVPPSSTVFPENEVIEIPFKDDWVNAREGVVSNDLPIFTASLSLHGSQATQDMTANKPRPHGVTAMPKDHAHSRFYMPTNDGASSFGCCF